MARRWTSIAAPGLPDGLFLFDGVCVFCSRWVAFVIARDPAARVRFLAIQTEQGRALAARLGIDAEDPQTNALILGERALFKSDAALAVLALLPRWGWTRVLRVLPRGLRDFCYDRIAGNRYKIFGRSDVCLVPGPALERHFWRGGLPGV